MDVYESKTCSARSAYLWGSCLLMLILAACGVPEPLAIAPSSMVVSTGVATIGSAATTTIRIPTNTLSTVTSATVATPAAATAPPSATDAVAHEVQAMPTLISPDPPTPESHQQSTAMGVPPATALPATSQNWQRYHNDRAGYSVDYPTTWTASEREDT